MQQQRVPLSSSFELVQACLIGKNKMNNENKFNVVRQGLFFDNEKGRRGRRKGGVEGAGQNAKLPTLLVLSIFSRSFSGVRWKLGTELTPNRLGGSQGPFNSIPSIIRDLKPWPGITSQSEEQRCWQI